MKVAFKSNLLDLLKELEIRYTELHGYPPNTVIVSESEYKELIKEVQRCNTNKSYIHYPFVNKTQINGLFVEIEKEE